MHEFKQQSLEKQVEAVRNEEREKTVEGLRIIGTEKAGRDLRRPAGVSSRS